MVEFEITKDTKDFDDRLLSFMYRKKVCDIDIVFNDERLSLHSIILAANSQYFEDNLINTNSKPNELILQSVDTRTMKIVLEYCYSGKMKLDQKDVLNMLKVSHFLIIQTVINSCCNILKSILSTDNCCEIWKVAKRLQLPDLEDIALEFIKGNLKEIIQSEGFLQFDHMELIDFLKSNIQNSSVIIDVLNSVKMWHNHDLTNRSEYLTKVLEHVKLNLIPIGVLVSESSKFCKTNEKCSALFMKSMNENRNDLMIVGGYTNEQANSVEIYNEQSNNWIKTEVGFKAIKFSSIMHEEKLIVIGGFNETTLNTVEKYDVKTWIKTTLSPMQQARYAFSCVIADGQIYAIGGISTNGIVLSSAEIYNPLSKEWKQIEPMPTARMYQGAVVVGNEIFVIGGFDDNRVRLSLNECYSLSTRKWRNCASMMEKRNSAGVAVVDGVIYVVGGFDGSKYLNSVERYDPKTDKWTYVNPISDPRVAVAAVEYNGNLVIAGGEDDNMRPLSTVQQYNPYKDEWKSLPSLNIARKNSNLVTIPQKLLI